MNIEFSNTAGVRDIPVLDTHHQSNVPGLFIVGDLADAPIIKVALRQGYEVAEHVAATLPDSERTLDYQVVIIGAGPAGVGAATALKAQGISYVVFERDSPFSTIGSFPRGKMMYMDAAASDNPTHLPLSDSTKEDLVDSWLQALQTDALNIEQPIEVLSAEQKHGMFSIQVRGANNELRRVTASRIILAAGKRGQSNKLGIDGEGQDHVQHVLLDPAAHSDQDVLVIGGGDTAVETAVALADAGATVVLSYRGKALHRCKPRNKDNIKQQIQSGQITVLFESRVIEIRSKSAMVRLSDNSEAEVSADQIFTMIGTQMPLAFLKRMGVRMRGDLSLKSALWSAIFMLVVYAFYCLKYQKTFYPFGPGQHLGFLHDYLKVDLGFRTVDASFWGTTIYALVILVFGVRAIQRYRSPVQTRRYLSLIGFQWIFLFGIPELLAPLIIDRPWKIYAVTVPWPLSTWSLIDAPSWADGNTTTAILWIAAGAVSSFVLIPLYVRKNGERFCSYLCGCGGLAETLGDLWRDLAPRGRSAKDAEVFGRIIFLLAIPVTLLVLNDAWAFFAKDALYSTKAFAQHWYGLMVDFWLASIIGVALYPYLGNRVWCRFFCPLRAYMEAIAARFSRLSIKSDDRCISCGECTRYCQMGIAVETFAQKQIDLNNTNSSCIQCGICVEVCPMDVLTVGQAGQAVSVSPSALSVPRATWEM